MIILNNALNLFFENCYRMSDVSVFNGVDAATGAPNMPATGAPQQSDSSDEDDDDSTLKGAEKQVKDIQEDITTLSQMNAQTAAKQQQDTLESMIQEFVKAAKAQHDANQTLIIQYKKNGVPNMEDPSQTAGAGAQAGAGGAAGAPATDPMAAGGADPMAGGMGAGMAGGADPMAGGGMEAGMAGGAGVTAPPAGSSVQGMTTYDDLNRQGVTGQGGSTMPVM